MKQNVFYPSARVLVKRDSVDRRSHFFKSFMYSMNKGGRVRARREFEEVQGYYTDSYDKRTGLYIIAITLLSVFDAFLTLNILDRGGIEVNPFMSALLDYNSSIFVLTKMVITGIGLLVVLVHINFQLFKVFSVKKLLVTILGGYSLLIGYELILLSLIS